MQPKNLEDVAIVIRPERDNIAVVTADFIEKEAQLNYRGESFKLSGRILRGQSFATRKIRKGQAYITLGDPIGLASRPVSPGDPINESNLEDRLPHLSVRYGNHRARKVNNAELASRVFDGYVRAD